MPVDDVSRHRIAPLLLAAVCLILSACTSPPQPTPRSLELLVPPPPLDRAGAGDPWQVSGLGGGDRAPRLALAQRDGLPAMRIVPGDRRLTTVRRLASNVLVTPYLSWSWHVTPTPAGDHPMSLVVGFTRDTATAPDAQRQPRPGLPFLPPHDHLLVIDWDHRPLRRGTLELAPDIGDHAARYVVRGGADGGGTWWVETLDLAAMFQRVWPALAVKDTTVEFVGITVSPAPPEAEAYVAGITLSR